MLDSYIIKRIQEERERAREGSYQPLRIERGPPEPPPRHKRDEETPSDRDTPSRGSVTIDFRL